MKYNAHNGIKAAEKITSENRKLRKYHVMIGERVARLMNMDLLKHEEKWQQIVQEIRQTMDTLENQHGYKNTKQWRLHWDYQLFKALEFQYKLGLESLHQNLTEIRVELIYKQHQLQFRPPFEEIRSNYYNIMRKFIRIPLTFVGVGDSSFFKVNN
jgi:dynein heavy chain 2